jgi:outer membrane protein, multidrug efflux system
VNRSLLCAALMLALCACTTPAPKSSEPLPVEIPDNWANAPLSPQATSLLQWWLRFDDPLLTRLVTQALQANTSVNGARAALRQARALRDAASAGLSPTLGSSAAAGRNFAASNNASPSAANNFRAGLDASWELDIFGANRSALDASEASSRASAASLGDVQVSVAAEVALAYITLRSEQARLVMASANLESQLETLQLTRWRLQAGLVTSMEAGQALAATEQTRAQMPALRTSIAQTRHALAVLTGQAPSARFDELAGVGPLPQVSAALALSLPAATLRQRPDVRAAEHNIEASLARVHEADAARAPAFKIGGSLGLTAPGLGSLFSLDSLAASVLASVVWPLFDGGAGLARVRAQQAALTQTQVTYQSAVLTALKDVENALVALQSDRERLSHLQLAADAATEAASLARDRYSSGLVDFQVVLETQRTQLTTQDTLASARADISADHVRLYKALGGGWVPDDPAAL